MKPLRKIIQETVERGMEWDWLECGHRIGRRPDHHNPTRRRCWKCLGAKPQDFDPSTLDRAE